MTGFSFSPSGPDLGGRSDADPRDATTIALLGHDMRAALSEVIGGLRLIRIDALDPPTREQIERARASAEVLARLLEQGLAVMQSDGSPAPEEDIHLRRFLTDLDLRWTGRAQENGLGFAMTLPDDLPRTLRIDRVALDRVLSNLLGNACKYCDHGTVRFEVAHGPQGWLSFRVRDDGPGFPEPLLLRDLPIGSRPAGMKKPGSGMGLPIAADLTARLGGRLALRNLAPQGAEARFDIPVLPMAGPDPDPDPRTVGTDPILSGKRVLIADGNPTSQTILAGFASLLGAEVVVVGDGVETIGRLQRESFDLLVVDIEMPRLSGLDVIRCLRAMPGAGAVMPVIAVTAYLLRSNRTAILAAGADETLAKPLMCPQAFAAAVRSALGRRGWQIGLAETSPGPAEPPLMDDQRLPRLLALAGPDIARDLLDRLMSDLSGVERGLVQAGTGPDWEAIRGHTHVLIALAGAVGGLRLQARAEALNQLAHRADRSGLPARLQGVLTLLDGMIQFVSQVRDHHQAEGA